MIRVIRGFLVAYGKKSWRKSLIKIWPMARNQSSDLRRNLYGNKIFKKILTENALEYLASGKDFMMDRIGDARNLNENLENNL